MRLILTEFVSLDGVCQGPGSETEDTTDGFTRGGWFVPYMDEAFIDIATDWIADADAFLFGRRTYQAFAEAWPLVTDPNDLFAPVVVGSGRRLFPEGSAPTGMFVKQSWTTPAGMLCVALETRGTATYANYTHGR